MGINFFKWFKSAATSQPTKIDITCTELFEAAQEYQIRELAFWTCVNMVANAMGRCEIRTYSEGAETQGREYYLWNYEPNVNQNSTAFIHKLIAKLYRNNEALIVNTRRRTNGMDNLAVADSWEEPEYTSTRQNEYRGVVIDNYMFNKTFYEKDVLHLRLNHVDIKPVIDGLYRSYFRLVSAAVKNYLWGRGQHWKVHVNQLAQGGDNWAQEFQKMIEAQVKPFIESGGAILPEFDGYAYENVGGSAGNSLSDTRDIRALVEDIFDFTARGFLIPPVLINGTVQGTEDANTRFLTNCIDPLCDQLQEEITRKRYGFDLWSKGSFVRVDSSSIIHFDIFANAANVEKLVGSGAYTINDVRRAANQPAINEPWANEHFMTLNIAKMGEATRSLTEGGT